MTTIYSSNQSFEYKFTVFTATYNRAHTLHRVYNSLMTQTFRDFEWLIVDDGSTDNTFDIVQNWKEEAPFPIRYFFQKNSGKHIAFNRGVKEAKGELFLNLDSDDACLANALERFKYYWNTIPANVKNQFSGATCLCQDENGEIFGDYFPSDVTDCNLLELRYKFHVQGEKWGFHRTDILQQFPFPEIPNQKFCPENLVWSKIAKVYKTRFINEALRVYHKGLDQLSKTAPLKQHAPAYVLWYKSILNTEIDYLQYSPINFLRSAANYSRFSFHIGNSLLTQIKELKVTTSKLLWSITLSLGYLLYVRDEFKQFKYTAFKKGSL
ncbi:MAG: glycosyltransferase family 2 protein [Scytonematopsis contorta HA4267-MV1]|jgi:glycosyltransferase involved in cell wall biosynthesis|nr:glycosyltransferase family 2 protein [Scytonematopsis contorta HA4267-MV1]